MAEGILYERVLAHGPAVRIRRISEKGDSTVTAVLEVDRRAGTPRADEPGFPPPLMEASGATDVEVVSALEPFARDDIAIARLLQEKGLR